MDKSDRSAPSYFLNDDGEFVIVDYNTAKPFSSFLPGIAGLGGLPMWAFYVNRGQAICSFGTQDKDHPILEFQPANRAYELVSRDGFRTFLNIRRGTAEDYYEPFQSHYRDRLIARTQSMIIAPHQLALEEVNDSLGLRFRVTYFTVPEDDYAGLVRILQIENTGADDVTMRGLDGLPTIVPYGVDNFCLKNMRRTIEAFVEVTNLDHHAAFYKAKVEPADRPDVKTITRGNFYLGFNPSGPTAELVIPIVDPAKVFGVRTDFSVPERFLTAPPEGLTQDQITQNQFPCAMGVFEATIPTGGVHTYVSIVGHATSVEELNAMVPSLADRAYIEGKQHTNRCTIESLTQNSLVLSSEPRLDQYVRQNFLDNVLRGGFPFTLHGSQSRSTLHLYSRKHGDLERDYNDFRLMPTPYSQGNGSYRDINQNRRCDLLFNPDVGSGNVEYFYNLIQLDGFNPLVLGEIRFTVRDLRAVSAVLKSFIAADKVPAVEAYLSEPFTPGGLLAWCRKEGVGPGQNSGEFIGRLLDHCRWVPEVEHGEGFWSDHWTYNLDLLEDYLAIYPDAFVDLLFAGDRFTFYDNPHRVQPRSEKYVLWDGSPRQLGAVVLDEEKAALIENRDHEHNLVRTEFGEGGVYRTSLFVKILCLVVNKLASLDPEGIGVEMEAGKPGWYDALNGLPGLFGSSVSETLEIKRHIGFLLGVLGEFEIETETIEVFDELNDFMSTLDDLLGRSLPPFDFWDQASAAKEEYREKTRLGVCGKTTTVTLSRVREFFESALAKLDQAIEKALDDESRTIRTYLRYEVTEYEDMKDAGNAGDDGFKRNGEGHRCIKPLAVKPVPLPLFLEGPVHYLRCRPRREQAREFAARVRDCDLFDETLKMYKVNAPLSDQPLEIGRARVFSPGWLENESIWLHMEYKYLLELLRNGLYDEFYEDFENVCIPFLDPETYGRSILENSSFLASSAYHDAAIHGNGYVARLSGATAEFIHMMQLMTVGARPFRLSPEGELQLVLMPRLPGRLFTEKEQSVRLLVDNDWKDIPVPSGAFSFMFLGKTLVTYHNRDRKDTFGEEAVRPTAWRVTDREGRMFEYAAEFLQGDVVGRIRDRRIERIDIELC